MASPSCTRLLHGNNSRAARLLAGWAQFADLARRRLYVPVGFELELTRLQMMSVRYPDDLVQLMSWRHSPRDLQHCALCILRRRLAGATYSHPARENRPLSCIGNVRDVTCA